MKRLIAAILLLQITLPVFSQLVIQMKREGGVSIVPCKVNGLNLSFIFDTGASDVTISLTEASFMLKNGYLRKEDIIGSEKYLDASGNITEGITINLREIEIEGLKLFNVKASIVKSLEAPLLLGQSALNKLGTVYLDLNKNQLTIANYKISPNNGTMTDNAIVNFTQYKKSLLLLAKSMASASNNMNTVSTYFTVNIHDESGDSLWVAPSFAYDVFCSPSNYYTYFRQSTENRQSDNSESKALLTVFKKLKAYSEEKGIDWNLLDTSNIKITSSTNNEIVYTFSCGNKEYCFATAISETSSDELRSPKVFLPLKIDSKSFFEFRDKLSKEFLTELSNIKNSKDQNVELSYFYETLANSFENSYATLPTSDKQKFSSINFEPAYWCERAANLGGAFLGDDEETLLKKLRLFSKGINLYERNAYPFTKNSYNFVFLYSYRGECKYKMEDYEGAYRDYKKAIDVYEKNIGAQEALKTSITEFYYDFANICYFLKKYDECNLSIKKGIATYSNDLDKYLVNVTLYRLHSLKGYLNYFIYKNKQQACSDWSRAGELGDKDAFDFIKKYCSR